MMRPYKHANKRFERHNGKFKMRTDGTGWGWELRIFEKVMTDACSNRVTYEDGAVVKGVD
jgi:hypothetical protein